jgi:hypothetical protein
MCDTPHYAECCILFITTINVIMLSIFILSVYNLNVFNLSVFMLTVFILSIFMLSVFNMSVFMLSVFVLSVFMQNVVTLSVVMLTVGAPSHALTLHLTKTAQPRVEKPTQADFRLFPGSFVAPRPRPGANQYYT